MFRYNKDDAICMCIVNALLALILSGIIRCMTLPTDGSEYGYLDNINSTETRAFTVISTTMFLDNIKTYVLQPGECKMLSAVAGGYRVINVKAVESNVSSRQSGHESDAARRYAELMKLEMSLDLN